MTSVQARRSRWTRTSRVVMVAAAGLLGALVSPVGASGQAVASPEAATVVYSNTFSDPPGTAYPEWGGATNVQSPNATQRFLGEWVRGSRQLTVPVAAGTQVKLSFRLYILLSWDGSSPVWGPDTWRVGVAGKGDLFVTSFSTDTTGFKRQAYPGTYPGPTYPAHTGATERNTLGYLCPPCAPGAADDTYDLSFTFVAPSDTLVVSFTSGQDEPWPNEGWGLDDVSVEVLSGSVPGAPVDVAASVSGSAAIVSFSPPASDGEHPITSYRTRCTSSTGGATRWAWAIASPAVVTGFTGNATYTCDVRALNELGAGPYSEPSASFTTPVGLASPPRDVTVTVTGGTPFASVAFTPPASDGGSPITFYTASCSSSTGGKPRSAAGVASPIAVARLTATQSYVCRVRAVNANGTGPSSAPSAPFIA